MSDQVVNILVEDFAVLAASVSKIIDCAVVSDDQDPSLSFMNDVAIIRRSLLENIDAIMYKILNENKELTAQIEAFISTAKGEDDERNSD